MKAKLSNFGGLLAFGFVVIHAAVVSATTCSNLFERPSASIAPRVDAHSLFSIRIANLKREISSLNHRSELVIRKLEQGRGHQWPELDPSVMVALAVAVVSSAADAKEIVIDAMAKSPQLGYLTRKEAEPVARLLVHQSSATNLFPARIFLYRILHDRGTLRVPPVTGALDEISQLQTTRFHLLNAISQLESAASRAADIATLRDFKNELSRLPRALQDEAQLQDATLDQVLEFASQGRAKSETAFRAFMETDPFFADFSEFSKHSMIFQLDREVPREKARMVLLRRKSFSNPALEKLLLRYEALVKAQPALASQ